jgi:hypothetical protein
LQQQLGDIRRNPPRFVFGEQLGGRTSAGLFLEIYIRQLLAGAAAGSGVRSLKLFNARWPATRD